AARVRQGVDQVDRALQHHPDRGGPGLVAGPGEDRGIHRAEGRSGVSGGRLVMAGAGTGDLPWGDPPDQARYVRVIGKPGQAAQAPWRLDGDLGRPDTVLDAGQVGALTVRVASTRGPSHRFYGTAREDAAHAVDIDSRYLAAAVADGVGSVTGSGHAARIAVRYALHRLHQRLGRRAVTEPGGLVQEIQDAIGQADQAL